MDWRWDFTFEVVLPKMVEAAGITVWATVASFGLALVGRVDPDAAENSSISLDQ